MSTTWRRCSSCKTEISFGAVYWVCSVSTCNRKRTGLTFCSVPCWEAHLPTMRHREAWAVEKRAPSREVWEREQREEAEEEIAAPPESREIRSEGANPPRRKVGVVGSKPSDEDLPKDILIVVTKLKKYIRARSGMNTSDTVLPVLSDYVRQLCDRAIQIAAEEGRKTVLDRDFERIDF